MAPGCRAKELDRARLTGWIECKALVRARLVREQRDDFQSIIGQSQKLILQALTGEVNPGDDRVKLATVALQHTLWRIVRAPSGSGLLEGIDEGREAFAE